MKMKRALSVLIAISFIGLFIFMLTSTSVSALPGSSVYKLQPCAGCHGEGSVKDYEDHMVVMLLDEKGNNLVNMEKGEVVIPYKKGKKGKFTMVIGTDDKAGSDHKLVGWFFKLPSGVQTTEGSVPYCYQQINYPGGGEFAYKGNQNLTSENIAFAFHRYFSGEESELWVAVGKRTHSKAGLSLKTLKVKWFEE